ncbi:MAG TPA: acyl-CoA carboxylase subunit beta [Solirubrobacteraceae bacterium]|jgi:acetyl-CoA carboxylase carboxyltransferase component|nr:acyl-CoA carboxylase subunit beta [Solirubrobacteraceae bacterium]
MSATLDIPRPATSTPRERLEYLCDPGSLHPFRTEARSRRMGERSSPGDGVLAASGRVNGRAVFCFAQEAGFAGGSLGSEQAETIVRLHALAGKAHAPVVGFVESAGARMQEGLAALAGYGRIFRQQVALSGRVPQISVVCGPSAGGGSYSPALTDFVIMTERASMFLTGPGVVAKVTGENVDANELGGPRVHAANGVCHAVAADDASAARLARRLLDYLPQSARERPTPTAPAPPPGDVPELLVPREPRKVYDIRSVARAIVDGGELLELSSRYARNIVCLLARIDGKAIGIVANQPRHLGGVIDAAASQKASRFVRTCNAFGLPLLVLVDTPGFLPGVKQERDGVIRHGAKLVYAFAESVVPRVTVVLRKAFGGAAIAMNSKQLGADYVLAWPSAEIGVMAARQAVEIIHRREIAAAVDPQLATAELAERYAAEHLSLSAAASEGFVDEVIDPADTRRSVIRSLASLDGYEPVEHPRGNIQL